MMKKIIGFCLILLLVIVPVQGQTEYAQYDPAREGIVSGYILTKEQSVTVAYQCNHPGTSAMWAWSWLWS